MDKFLVRGGAELNGQINISGSKNSSLPILAATLLTDEPCIIGRVPDVSDTNYMIQILQNLGAHVERSSGTVRIEAKEIHHEAPYDLVRRMRASVCVMGPLTARLKRAEVSLPGGCVIGDRPVDLHLRGLRELGADVQVEGGNILINAESGLHGKEINMLGSNGSTVLGTDNLIMAAVLAEGTTIIDGAAAEPEVKDLCDFLIKMGARIEGAGTRRIIIQGVEKLHGAEHTVIPDRIEAGTYLVAGAVAGGTVTINRACAEHLSAVIDALRECGHQITVSGEKITVTRNPEGKGCVIITDTYPGFPTDMQAQMCALFTVTPGISVVTENIFPERFMHIAEMARMGGSYQKENATVTVTGTPGGLTGAPVMASDLRASAALVLVALCARGETEINRVYHIDRGYEHIDEKLQQLGADIQRVRA